MRNQNTHENEIRDCVVVGGGPAGMAAAIAAARAGMTTVLLEKNRRPGTKLLLTGGGRCNLTNLGDTSGFVAAYGPGGNFLRGALAAFSPDDLCDFMRESGVALVTEGANVFSRDGAQAVLNALERAMKKHGVEVVTSAKVAALMKADEGWTAVTYRGNFTARKKMILAVGGLTYAATGSSGDGYAWLERLGHTLVPPRPAAGPLALTGNPFGALAGVSVERAKVELFLSGRKSGSFEGPLLFTRDGVSGPVVLDASLAMARAASALGASVAVEIVLDFAPDSSDETLEAVFQAMRQASPGKAFGNASPLPEMPNRLYRALLARAGCDAGLKLAEVPKKQIRALLDVLKRIRLGVKGFVGANDGMVTVGGVSTREIDARTMGSLVAPGIFFAGEFIDIAGPCGGFNLQAAFSTGFLAGAWTPCGK